MGTENVSCPSETCGVGASTSSPACRGSLGCKAGTCFGSLKGGYLFLDLEEASICSYTGAYKSQCTGRIPGTFLLWLSPRFGQVAFACI